MDLVQFDPFSLFRDFDRQFSAGRRPQAWLPSVDVLDRGDDLVIRVEVSGVTAEDIDLTIEDRTLTIAGSRTFEYDTDEGAVHRREIRTGSFERTLVLPEGINPEEITASVDNGILEIAVPRRPEVLPRKVKVEIAKG
ncbi:MAG: Hsp20/alpha crystallin family protein [Actinobacteria bacterium]|nr:Hsp20/alpha crystallin family protein [Actinomycetota bacterium]